MKQREAWISVMMLNVDSISDKNMNEGEAVKCQWFSTIKIIRRWSERLPISVRWTPGPFGVYPYAIYLLTTRSSLEWWFGLVWFDCLFIYESFEVKGIHRKWIRSFDSQQQISKGQRIGFIHSIGQPSIVFEFIQSSFQTFADCCSQSQIFS